MATLVNRRILLRIAPKSQRVRYTGAEIKATKPTQETAKRVPLDDPSFVSDRPVFNTIKLAHIKFAKPIATDSSLYGKVFADKQVVKFNITKYHWLYSSYDWEKWSEGLRDDDELDVYVFQTSCFANLSVQAANTEEEWKSSCGTEKYAKDDTSYTISLTGAYQVMDVNNIDYSITSKMLGIHFAKTIEKREGLKTLELPHRESFIFEALIQSQEEGSASDFEGWVTFEGTSNQTNIEIGTDKAVQQFTTPISNQSPPYFSFRDYTFDSLLDDMGRLSETKRSSGSN